MGVYYVLRAEGTEETIRGRLEAVRERCPDLPLKWVGDVQRIEPFLGDDRRSEEGRDDKPSRT